MSIASTLTRIEDSLIEIPAGETVIGTDIETVRAGIDRDVPGFRQEWLQKEIPRHVLAVDAFRITRVPLTIAQVRALGVEPTRAGGPDHPATLGVAGTLRLCATLSASTGKETRLPTEEEWVRAARGDDLRIYPWGDEWRDDAANMDTAGHGATCPVGQYPAGESAFGLLDMAGNTDELTSTIYAPFPGAPTDVPDHEEWARAPYVTKGGGFTHMRDVARCDRRHGIYGDDEPLAIRLVIG
jgi:formylglycine-generating enzyme required for sulfatase activity